jgi:hypothetical protein
MSDVIDWSKAPEGATHYAADSGFFVRKIEHTNLFSDDVNLFVFNGERLITRPDPSPWTGEGRPPVGLTVRIPDDMACGNEFLEQFEGLTVEIVGHTENDINTPLAIFRYKVDGSYRYHALCGDNGNFEPIRTPEQIAADERDAAIKEMTAKYSDSVEMLAGWAAYVYDTLGYRKQ